MDPIVMILNEEKLLKAIKRGRHNDVKELLDSGVSPNSYIKSTHPLFLAIDCYEKYGSKIIFNMLLDHPLIDKSIVDSEGNDLLDRVIIAGFKKLTEQLILSGDFSMTKQSYISNASRVGNQHAIRLLFEHNASIADKDLIGIVQYLIHQPTNIIERTIQQIVYPTDNLIHGMIYETTYLENLIVFDCIIKHYPEIVRRIVNRLDIHNQTLLHDIMYIDDNTASLLSKSLLQLGADPNVRNNNGDTPLHFAVYVDSFEIVEILLNSGADCSIKNNMGKDALSLATDDKIRELITNFHSLDIKEPCCDNE